MEQPGDCSPSLSVVSKIMTRSLSRWATSVGWWLLIGRILGPVEAVGGRARAVRRRLSPERIRRGAGRDGSMRPGAAKPKEQKGRERLGGRRRGGGAGAPGERKGS